MPRSNTITESPVAEAPAAEETKPKRGSTFSPEGVEIAKAMLASDDPKEHSKSAQMKRLKKDLGLSHSEISKTLTEVYGTEVKYQFVRGVLGPQEKTETAADEA